MRLFAALVPPAVELDRALAALAGVAPVAEPSSEPAADGRHRAGARRWFARRRSVAPELVGPMLDLVPTPTIHLPLMRFGNLSNADAGLLADELQRRSPEWASPRLRLARGAVLTTDGQTSVWTALSGDLDEVRDLIRGIAHVAQGQHMYVDRRMFRPEVRLATANELTTEAYLAAVQAELDLFESNAWWQTTIAMMIANDDAPEGEPLKTFREITLGPAVGH